MEELTDEILDSFFNITKYDVREFLNRFASFSESEYNDIVNYFSGKSKTVNGLAFDNLNKLISDHKEIMDIFTLNKSSFENYDAWILLEVIQDVGSRLSTMGNASRWLRSSITSDGFRPTTEVDYIAKQGESLEDIQANVLSSNNPNEDWVDLALSNDLNEEKYTHEGGYLLRISFRNRDSLFISTIVDNINSVEKTFGLDLNKDIEFVDNDLATLGYRETLFQTVDILSNLRRGDNPFYPNDGVDETLISGRSGTAITYPTVFRQMAATFIKDDSLTGFSIIDVSRDRDSVSVVFSVKSRAGDIERQISI